MKITKNIFISSSGIEFYDKHGHKLSYSEGVKKIANRFESILEEIILYVVHSVTSHVPFHSIRNTVLGMVGVRIGKGSVVHMGAKFFSPEGVSVGDDTIIGDCVFLDGRGTIKIGSHVDIASQVMIYTSEHDINSPEFKAFVAPVVVGDYVFIGPRVIILPGVTIKKGAILAAGAVVTKDVGEFEMVGGVPAKVIGKRKNQKLNYVLGRPRLFQ